MVFSRRFPGVVVFTRRSFASHLEMTTVLLILHEMLQINSREKCQIQIMTMMMTKQEVEFIRMD